MSVDLHYNLSVKAKETLADDLDLGTGGVLTHEIAGLCGFLDANTTIVVTKAWSDQGELVAGTKTIDLTSLSRGADLAAEDFTGAEVKFAVIHAVSTNTSAIVVATGGANGYWIFGSAGGEVSIPAGGHTTYYAVEGNPTVAVGAKNIDITSADVDAKYDIILVAGTV